MLWEGGPARMRLGALYLDLGDGGMGVHLCYQFAEPGPHGVRVLYLRTVCEKNDDALYVLPWKDIQDRLLRGKARYRTRSTLPVEEKEKTNMCYLCVHKEILEGKEKSRKGTEETTGIIHRGCGCQRKSSG